MAPSEDPLIAAALHVYGRYEREFIEAHNLCPYAKAAREVGAVGTMVITSADIEDQALSHIRHLAAQPEIEIGLLLFPRVELDRLQWERWVSRLVGLDTPQHPLGGVPFAMAAFHPDAPLPPRTPGARPETLVPFIRRTPDPTIQLVRLSALERVRRGSDEGTKYLDMSRVDLATYKPVVRSSLRERISHSNQQTLETWGFDHASALLEDIRRERDDLYAQLGVTEKPATTGAVS